MAQRSAVPKFGNWENGDNVPYTVYFEKARKSRSRGHTIHLDPAGPQNHHHARSLDPPLQTDDAIGLGNAADTLRAKHRPTDSSISEPPARQIGSQIGCSSVGASRKDSIGQASATPGRSRLRSADDYAVPKFGEWDENDPASADGYTLIFNNVKERRNGGSARSLSASSNQNSLTAQRRNPTSKSVSCFCWG